MLTKSDLLDFLTCRKYLWLKNHKPAEAKREYDEIDEYMKEQGYAVEALAKEVFKGMDADFQMEIEAGDCYARADIVTKGPKGTIIINEVKSSKNKVEEKEEDREAKKAKEKNLNDVTFQRIIFEKAGHKVSQVNLVLLNRDYVRKGEIDPQKLIVTVDVTAETDKRRSRIEAEIKKALALIASSAEPEHLALRPCCKFKECLCPDSCFKDLPEYPIYELNRITMGKKKLPELEDAGIFDIRKIPDDFGLTNAQLNQVVTAKAGSPIIDQEAIQAELEKLEYPLYFLDYETFSPAIPMYDGYYPFQHITFQYSLHVIESPGAEVKHFEFLSTENSDPTLELLKSLKGHVGEKGSVVVWNKSFEMARNKEMAIRFPEFEPLMTSINSRIFDLMDIFKDQLYVHPEFRGSCSIKKVLPVLVPKLNHAELDISEGSLASVRWYRMVMKQADFTATKARLLEYCKMDTVAMVEIFKVLNAL